MAHTLENTMEDIQLKETQLKNEYREYTLGLALFDLVPVVLFLMSGIVIHSRY